MQFLITFGFIVLDFLSGMLKATGLKQFSSTRMREGFFHKVALLLCMLLGYGVDFAQNYVDLGFNVPVSASICVYIVLMEVASILENLCSLNPELVPESVRGIFASQNNGKGGE
ncbi:MAG: phage holin family protein [Oscillospiraceae bacterium]|nr:phage holin family protein [Oscillospiraceae bacterium]